MACDTPRGRRRTVFYNFGLIDQEIVDVFLVNLNVRDKDGKAAVLVRDSELSEIDTVASAGDGTICQRVPFGGGVCAISCRVCVGLFFSPPILSCAILPSLDRMSDGA